MAHLKNDILAARELTKLEHSQARKVVKASLPVIARKVAVLIGIDNYQDPVIR